MNTEAIPAELRALDHWVLWRWELVNERRTKVLYRATAPTVRASSTAPDSWASYATAVREAVAADGIGFVFSQDDPYCGVDLDACVKDGELHPDAARLVERLDSYTETSPSGTGVHVLVRADLNGGRKRTSKTPWGGGFEAYDEGRYFTITGDHARGRRVRSSLARASSTPSATSCSRRSRGPDRRRPSTARSRWTTGSYSTERAPPGTGRTSTHSGGATILRHPSQNEADLDLCARLAFWTGGDADRIDSLFRQSGLAGEKWERDDYRQATIEKAIAGCSAFYDEGNYQRTERVNNGTGQTDAAEKLTKLLKLDTVGLSIQGARVVGRGSRASADLYLSDGSEVYFESLRDIANPSRLTLEITACTGATPMLKAPMAIKAVALLRTIAKHHEAVTADHIAIEWGSDYLQAADVLDVDMNHQGARWAAFSHLKNVDPFARSREEGSTLAGASTVLRHTDGTRYVRCGWFKDVVRGSDATVSPQELALRMERVGWERRANTGRIKASQPLGHGVLGWTFYTVPVGWAE